MIVTLIVVMFLANGTSARGDKPMETLEECAEAIKGFAALEKFNGIKINGIVAGCSIDRGKST